MPSWASSETRIAALTAAAPRRSAGRPLASSSSRLVVATARGAVRPVAGPSPNRLGQAAVRGTTRLTSPQSLASCAEIGLAAQEQELAARRSPTWRIRSCMTTAGDQPAGTSG